MQCILSAIHVICRCRFTVSLRILSDEIKYLHSHITNGRLLIILYHASSIAAKDSTSRLWPGWRPGWLPGWRPGWLNCCFSPCLCDYLLFSRNYGMFLSLLTASRTPWSFVRLLLRATRLIRLLLYNSLPHFGDAKGARLYVLLGSCYHMPAEHSKQSV